MTHLVIMAGGTGGHIVPALAVAKTLSDQGVSISWVGSADGLEAKMVAEADIEFDAITIKGLRQSGVKRKVMMPFMLLYAMYQSYRIIRKRRPDGVLGMGGFVSGPGGIVAGLLGVPVILHEQNTIAGLTNRWLSKFSKKILTGFPKASGIEGSEWVGNPVRKDIVMLPDPQVRLANRQEALRILVVGGSQGAREFNDELARLLSNSDLDTYSVRHQCGRGQVEKVRASYADTRGSVEVMEFIDDMSGAYEWSDIVICRAGAVTVSEICAAGAVTIFIPYPYAVNDHQSINADYLVHGDAGYLVNQQEFVEGGWMTMLKNLDANRLELIETAKRARALARPNAADRVAKACLEVLNA